MTNLSRRSLLIGSTASILAAPAIVRASSLMKVKVLFADAYNFPQLKWEDESDSWTLNDCFVCMSDRAFDRAPS